MNTIKSSGAQEADDFEAVYRPPVTSLDLPPITLARDLGSLVGDREFSDVRFIAEGRTVSAHRFVLESRSEYFRAMFRSGMTAEAANLGGNRTIDVVVPGMLASNIYIYIFDVTCYGWYLTTRCCSFVQTLLSVSSGC